MLEEIASKDIEKTASVQVLKVQMKQQKQLIIWKKLLKVTATYINIQNINCKICK